MFLNKFIIVSENLKSFLVFSQIRIISAVIQHPFLEMAFDGQGGAEIGRRNGKMRGKEKEEKGGEEKKNK